MPCMWGLMFRPWLRAMKMFVEYVEGELADWEDVWGYHHWNT